MSATAAIAQSTTPSTMPSSSTRRQPRPTTYSGPAVSSSAAQSGSSYAPPIPPPPRTSSQKNGSPNVDGSGSGSNKKSSRQTSSNSPRDGTKSSRAAAASVQVTSTSGRGEKSAPSRSESTRETSRRREENGAAPPPVVGTRNDSERNASSSNRDSRKETRFGNYILGQTLGEGEFGKVKLGWRRDGGAQVGALQSGVAIKLIRRDTLAPHPNRLSKIYREISILRTLSHPNIVRLHEMVETDRHIGIILEYASGGELFDYILTHRYLKDPPACRLFAQLVSGVGYLHKMGIVHRDLKLENLLLDRNRNIIITDFGFANVFNPKDDIAEYEDRLDDPEVLRQLEIGVREDGVGRRGDLMATSCGSPCYAAPELVVSERVYTGRKVDVWSCGVILYAMLAGYLPFDDDPANPEGDNINLLYKYIVSTPLTFPEYVTPHARDLLRRILVPDPRKRADLFEVARHSWLSPFANVVGLITSSTTSTQDIMTTTVTSDGQDGPQLMRSASVREPSTTTHTTHAHQPSHSTHGAVAPPRHQEHSPSSTHTKTSGDTKRNTVQVEYAPPKSQTKRGEHPTADDTASPGKSKHASKSSKHESTSPKAVADSSLARAATTAGITTGKQTKADAVKAKDAAKHDHIEGSSKNLPHQKGQQRAISYHPPGNARPPSPIEAPPVPAAPSTQAKADASAPVYGSSSTSALPVPQNAADQRPTTGDNGKSNVSRSASARVTSNTPYSKPIAPAVNQTTAQGKLQQPASKKPYSISRPIPQNAEDVNTGVSGGTVPVPGKTASNSQKGQDKGHKRANTVGSSTTGDRLFGKILGTQQKSQQASQNKQQNAAADSANAQPAETSGSPRPSLENDAGPTDVVKDKKQKRFSLIPTGLLKGMSIHDKSHPPMSMENHTSDPTHKTSASKLTKHDRRPSRTTSGVNSERRGSAAQLGHRNANGNVSSQTTPSSSSVHMHAQQAAQQKDAVPPVPPHTSDGRPSASRKGITDKRSSTGIAIGKNRRFAEAYEGDAGNSSGSTSAARRVMDFFRKRAIGRSKP